MTAVVPPEPEHDEEPSGPATTRRAWVAVAGLVAVLALGITLVVMIGSGPGGGPPPGDAGPAPTTGAAAPTTPAGSAAPTPSPSAPPTATIAPVVPPEAVTAVWPTSGTSVRYPDPVAAARGFAVDLVGFRAPVTGPFQAGDSRSGEVEVRPEPTGPVTTVLVRQFGDGTWWVLGAATADIELDSPAAGDTVSSPVVLTGRALAFEGLVTVRIVEDGSSVPLATGSVLGGGDEPRPFEGEFPLRTPTASHGAVLLTTESARDGQRWTASVIRVGFAG